MSDLEHLRKLAPRVPRARRRMVDNLPGYGTGGDGGSRGTDTEGGRTAALGSRLVMTHDQTLADLEALDQLCPGGSTRALELRAARGSSITREVDRLHRLVNTYDLTPEREENLRASADNGGEPGCRSCAKIGRFDDVHRAGLCAFCYRWLPLIQADYEWDQDHLPPRMVQWRWDHPGKNVTTNVVAELMRGQRRRVDA